MFGLEFVYVEDLMMINTDVFFNDIIDSEPKNNFGDEFYYSFENIVKIGIPKKKLKKFKKRTK